MCRSLTDLCSHNFAGSGGFLLRSKVPCRCFGLLLKQLRPCRAPATISPGANRPPRGQPRDPDSEHSPISLSRAVLAVRNSSVIIRPSGPERCRDNYFHIWHYGTTKGRGTKEELCHRRGRNTRGRPWSERKRHHTPCLSCPPHHWCGNEHPSLPHQGRMR